MSHNDKLRLHFEDNLKRKQKQRETKNKSASQYRIYLLNGASRSEVRVLNHRSPRPMYNSGGWTRHPTYTHNSTKRRRRYRIRHGTVSVPTNFTVYCRLPADSISAKILFVRIQAYKWNSIDGRAIPLTFSSGLCFGLVVSRPWMLLWSIVCSIR